MESFRQHSSFAKYPLEYPVVSDGVIKITKVNPEMRTVEWRVPQRLLKTLDSAVLLLARQENHYVSRNSLITRLVTKALQDLGLETVAKQEQRKSPVAKAEERLNQFLEQVGQ